MRTPEPILQVAKKSDWQPEEGATKRIIFCDVNGVLDSWEDPFYYPGYHVDSDRCGRLADLANRTGAEIVLSSTARRDREALFALRRAGLPIRWTTPVLEGGESDRAKEIQHYVEKCCIFSIFDFVIIDDQAHAEIKGHFYQTNPETGLTEAICLAIALRWSAPDLSEGDDECQY